MAVPKVCVTKLPFRQVSAQRRAQLEPLSCLFTLSHSDPSQTQGTAGTCGVPQTQQVERRVSETRVRIAVPSIKSDLGNELYFVKLPRFLRIEPK